MDLVAVDENGELYCPYGVTDTPQYIPGLIDDPVVNGNSPGHLPIAKRCHPTATSALPGRDAIYATDESSITWWESALDDPAPAVTCDLKSKFTISSSRMFWRESGLDYQKGIVPRPNQVHHRGLPGRRLVHAARPQGFRGPVEYRLPLLWPKLCDKVRLTITGAPEGVHPGVIDFTVFGVCEDI